MPTRLESPYRWKFFRAGGFDQVRLDSGADLVNLDQLDQKLWVALACPTTGLEFDAKTLALVDTDKDGRVRAPELVGAVRWAGSLLKNPDDLARGADSLPLSAINDATDEGKALLASARQILGTLKKAEAGAISVEDTTRVTEKFVETVFNGDGIIIEESASDAATKAVIRDILACAGSEPDRSGKPGISQAKVDLFFAEAKAYSDWWQKAESDAVVLPLGAATGAAAAAVRAVKAKVDDYFTRCRLAAFDARAAAALNREEKEFLALAAKDLTLTATEIAGLPLARVKAGRPLPLDASVNPAWSDAVARLRADAVQPLLGTAATITEADWAALLAKLAPFEAWSAGKVGASVEKLGLQRVREILNSDARETLTQLIAEDKKLEPQFAAIASVDKLVRYCRDLRLLCTNFVNFKDFYSRTQPAIFQAGRLYLDQRSCDLTLPVADAGRHAMMAGLAGTYLAYCDCVRKGTGEKMQIVAAFTDGDSDNLMVGRNGIFYDRHGRDWDATITKIIDNPISLRQAFWAPYKKLARMIEEQVAKRAAAAESTSTDTLAQAAQGTVQAAQAPQKPKIDIGIVAALGVAFGSIGTALAYVLGLFKGIPGWKVPLVVLGLMLLVSAPSMMLAYLKLRKRNLGPILDANGWAVNAKAKINVPFGTSLTSVAKLPPGSSVDLGDRFAEKAAFWPKILVVLFFVWWIHSYLFEEGWLYRWTDGKYGKNPAAQVITKPDDKGAKDTKAAGDAAAKALEPAK
jgi:hypothetical protein